MRASLPSLALAALLVSTGCQTLHDWAPAAAQGLSPDSARFAEALARYSQSLISEFNPGGNDASLRQLRLACDSDPSNLPLALKVAAGYLGRKDYDRALTVLQRAASVHPDDVDLRLLLGIVYQLRESPRQAVREYRAAIRLAPDQADAYIRLATLHAAETQRGRALSVIDAGLRKVGDPGALLRFCEMMGRLYLQGGDPGAAIDFFERIRRRQPDNAAVVEGIARCQSLAGRNRKAIATLLELSRTQPASPARDLLLGELYEAENDPVRAEEYLGRAARAVPHDVPAVLKLAHLQLRTAPDRALKTLKEAVAAQPDDLNLRAFLGLALTRDRQYDAAIAVFAGVEQAMAKTPDASMVFGAQFYFWYGSACDQAGKTDEAERLLELAIDADPDFSMALNYLAYTWATRGVKLDQAMDYVTRALKLVPDESAYLDTLGWVHYKLGNLREAVTYLQKALDGDPDEPEIAEHLGDAWAALKESRRAIRFWRISLEAKPDNAALRAKLVAAGVDAAKLPPGPEKKEPEASRRQTQSTEGRIRD